MYKNAVTTIGAAQILGVSLDELFDLIAAGKIPYYKGYHTNLGFMFFETELREWKQQKLIRESSWIDTTLTAALYGNAKPKNISELVSVEVAEKFLQIIEKEALLK
jgi:hypothetical protein